MRILIYAYGFIGKNNYEFMKQFVDEVYVYDDMLSELNYQKQFIKTLKNSKFDSILVSVANKNTYKNIKDNLSEIFPENIIHFAPIFMEKPSDLFLNFISNKFDLNLIKNFDLEKIQNRLKELKTIYFEFRANFDKEMLNKRKSIDEKYADLDIFGKLYKTSSINTKTFNINYPGFSVSYNANCDSRSFYFKDKIDFEKLQNRDKKLIVLFGNSFIRHDWLKTDKGGISDFIKVNLKNQIVINAAIHGATLYEQLLVYNALFYKLKPDVVMSFFGGTDYFHAMLGDEILLKNHSIIYNTSISEVDTKELFKSSLPLYLDYTYSLKKLVKEPPNLKEICNALYDRYVQFYSVVNANGGLFLGFLQPFLSKKKYLTSSEQELNKPHSIENEILKTTNNFIDEFNKTSLNLKNYTDLNEIIKDESEICFYDHWLHCTKYANEKISKVIIKRLKTSEIN
ncbi:TPA: hypothetical protein RPW15_001341 [Campylobacter fetus subsp. venerealis]|uniref:Uncharacterized protein n=6 Tax=Campylobacter fetus TaxID=196 RepID=A0A5L8QQS0_CAMFE|nr:hypothetical protein [Campylobacter fetus]OCS25880.1 hypothetical protein CFVB10_06605 [Campylobacter fetus subsp. venerealis cfvB10]OCS29469.1 hypothetical protein CFVCCUG33900_06030 [Campylobacter fetus subsp. venerealis LMG 6570 = CCUG 33900]AHE94924.1 hypothetical protein CFVI03293_1648 [Campylobacter fetus subsp. venerealis cfvi03/293]AIR81344.1 hypothetical protein CFV97608_1751 [Campylobacter fetus subsp. venerealis 97/608]EAI4415483.1 hypothetical protein [Campylobacter fetus]